MNVRPLACKSRTISMSRCVNAGRPGRTPGDGLCLSVSVLVGCYKAATRPGGVDRRSDPFDLFGVKQ
jgi:hypothetical protein